MPTYWLTSPALYTLRRLANNIGSFLAFTGRPTPVFAILLALPEAADESSES